MHAMSDISLKRFGDDCSRQQGTTKLLEDVQPIAITLGPEIRTCWRCTVIRLPLVVEDRCRDINKYTAVGILTQIGREEFRISCIGS